MEIQARKYRLIKALMEEKSVEVIEQLEAFFEKNEFLEEDIFAYTPAGKSITTKQMQKRIETAEQQIKKGNSISHEELKKQVAGWGK